MKQFQIQTTLEEVSLDFLLTIGDAGKIQSVEPMIYELPEITQKMILGDKKQILDRQIEGYSGLIYYIIKLLLSDRLLSERETYKEVISYIRSSPGFSLFKLDNYWDQVETLITTEDHIKRSICLQ